MFRTIATVSVGSPTIAGMGAELPELLVRDAAAWRSWLLDHHDSAPGVWLVLTKKGGTLTTLDY